jgi:predicted enzyme related to lactoylglutathione lyase
MRVPEVMPMKSWHYTARCDINLAIMTPTQTSAVVHQIWPLLAVSDIARSIEFYSDQLGFSVAGTAESDGRVFWCRLERGGVSIMLQQAEEEEDGPAEGRGRGVTFYFICNDADAMHADLSSRGLQVSPPRMTDYRMKQLFVPEPNGYLLCFESPA